MTPLLLFLLGCAAIYVGTVTAAFSALMQLSLRIMAERSGRDDRLGKYLDDPRQAQYVQQGWNLTGDAYRIADDGQFEYQARTDDMIVSGGYNIAGPEVEAALLLHPAVAECGVVGLPDAERGMLVTAHVVLKPGHAGDDAMTRALQDFVKQTIAPYKYPRRIVYRDSLPRTETGKLQRFRLREGAP